MSKFYIIWGVAGGWKWTLMANLEKTLWDKIHMPLSYKTRPLRDGEVNGVSFYQVTRDEFKASIDAWEFLEYAFVHNLDYYWTKIEDIFEKGLDKGKIVVKEIEFQGVNELRENHSELMDRVVTIFLDVPDEIMVERMKFRDSSISDSEVQNRLLSAKKERDFARSVDYLIDTSELTPEEVLGRVLEIIEID